MARQVIDTTLADVDSICRLAGEAISRYLSGQRVPQDENGFFATALSGDEDQETIARYTAIYQPLKSLLHTISDTLSSHAINSETLESEATWHSRQFEVAACTGEESDEKIATIFRESLVG